MIIIRQSCVVIDLTPMCIFEDLWVFCGERQVRQVAFPVPLLSREYCVCVKTGMVKTVDFREKNRRKNMDNVKKY